MFKNINVKRNEIAVVYKDQEVTKVLTSGKHSVFALFGQTEIKRINLGKPQVEAILADYLKNFCPEIIQAHCIKIETSDDEVILRYEDEKLVEILLPTTKALFWKSYIKQGFITVKLIDGYQLPEKTAQEIFYVITANQTVKGLDKLKIAHITKEQVGVLFINKQVKTLIAGDSIVGYCGYQHEVMLACYAQRDSEIINEKLADAMLQALPEQVTDHCVLMEVGADQAGLRYENNVLVEILPPGSKRLYWQSSLTHRLVKIDLRQGYILADDITQQLLQPKLRNKGVVGDASVLVAQIPAYYVGILKVDGEVQSLLNAGITAYWRFNREISVEVIDTRLQDMEVTGQEILTKDKVNLRINLVANWRYNDVLLAHKCLARPNEHLYRELQFGLREAVGTRTLDELLENKHIIDEVVSQHIAKKMQDYGIETASLGVKDIILPGDMKDILAKVVEAEKSAQANVIRRREETAATRSLLNTAKVMENNPVALRLKEMETLERIAERIDKISVFGGLDQVLNGLVNINPIQAPSLISKE